MLTHLSLTEHSPSFHFFVFVFFCLLTGCYRCYGRYRSSGSLGDRSRGVHCLFVCLYILHVLSYGTQGDTGPPEPPFTEVLGNQLVCSNVYGGSTNCVPTNLGTYGCACDGVACYCTPPSSPPTLSPTLAPVACTCPIVPPNPPDNSCVCFAEGLICPAGKTPASVHGPCINCPDGQSSVAGGPCLDTCVSTDVNCAVALRSSANSACVCASCNDGSMATGAGCPVSHCYGSLTGSNGNSISGGTCTCTTAVFPPGIRAIANYAFLGPSTSCPITTAVIPDTVTTIGLDSFGFCTALSSVTIPSSVTFIGIGGFFKCTSLKSVTIPSGVTSLDEYAFSQCSSLACVSIPQTITSIGVSAFFDNPKLTSTNVPPGVSYIGGNNIVSSIFNCVPNGAPTTSPGTICNAPTTTVIVSNSPNYCS